MDADFRQGMALPPVCNIRPGEGTDAGQHATYGDFTSILSPSLVPQLKTFRSLPLNDGQRSSESSHS